MGGTERRLGFDVAARGGGEVEEDGCGGMTAAIAACVCVSCDRLNKMRSRSTVYLPETTL